MLFPDYCHRDAFVLSGSMAGVIETTVCRQSRRGYYRPCVMFIYDLG